jgi:hypothetical protein
VVEQLKPALFDKLKVGPSTQMRQHHPPK